MKAIPFLKQLFFSTLSFYFFFPPSVLLAQPCAYITNYNEHTVSVIDTATNLVIATIPVGHCPDGVAVNPTGALVYVANSGDGNVSVINTATNTVTDTIPVGVAPRGVAVNLSGSRVYVTNYRDNTVSIIDTAVNSAVATVHVGTGPCGVAVNRIGTYVYVANSGSNSVSVINSATNSVTDTIFVGNGPCGLVVDPAGESVYVANSWSDSVSVIATMTNTVVASVPVGQSPWGIAIDPAGSRVYVTNWGDDTVSIIDTGTNAATGTVFVGALPQGIAVNQIGSRVYVANYQDDTVSAFDTETGVLISTIAVGDGPNAFGEFIGPGYLENVQFVELTTDLSGAPAFGAPIAFTVNAASTQYKFWYRAGYGTSAYNDNPWMVMQEYSTDNTCAYTFPSEDNYIVVVHGTGDPNTIPSPIPLIGMNVNVGGETEGSEFIGLSANIAATPKVGVPITFTVNFLGSYCKFWYRAGYGTSAYNDNPWMVMQEYSTDNTSTHAFQNADNYIVVVHSTNDLNNVPDPVPMIGMNVKVETQ